VTAADDEQAVPPEDGRGGEGPVAGSPPPPADAGAVEAEPAATATIFADRLPESRRYVELLATAGVVRGLVGPREGGRLWTRHVLNSGVVAALLPPDARVVDVGSGAGLPGIPMALARPDCAVVLVEPLARRCDFLREVVEELAIGNCTVVRGRADEVVEIAGDADVVTSRAVAPLGRLAQWCAPLLRTGGEMIALKGSSAPAEIQRDGALAARVGLVDLRVESVGAELLAEPTVVLLGRKAAVRTTTGRRQGPAGVAAPTTGRRRANRRC
jgi:16S rRNA (guanine527-N7)-methyltransferase